MHIYKQEIMAVDACQTYLAGYSPPDSLTLILSVIPTLIVI